MNFQESTKPLPKEGLLGPAIMAKPRAVSSKDTPSVFEFTDFRAFLQAFARDKKKSNSRWSYGLWAKQLGLKNSTSILKILNGDRDAGPEITRKLVEYFEFTEKESTYFQSLVRLSKASDDPAIQVAIMEQLRKIHPKRSFTLLDEKTFSAISNWWFYAIRQMASWPDFQNDAGWISNQLEFKVLPREITRAIRLLTEMGLLKLDETTQKLVPAPQGLNTTDDVASEALKRFHEEVLELGKASLRKTPVKKRQISGVTLSVKSEELPRIKEFLRSMEDEFIEKFESKEGDTIYQLELACFPLTKKQKEEGRK